MNNHHSSYTFWTWLVAILLALFLLWALLTGRTGGGCCSASVAPVEEAMPAVAVEPAAEATAETCQFSASSSEYTANAACANLAWAANADALKASLIGDMRAEGDDKSVVLTGTVDSEEIKAQKGIDAQTFFGTAVTIDNQLQVKAAEPVAMEAPPAAKVYFDTGKTTAPAGTDANLAAISAWLSAHPEAKAVISGFHDPRGNVKQNEDLAYNRAKAVQAALLQAGVDVMRIEFLKPESTDGGGDLAEARRVEVSIK